MAERGRQVAHEPQPGEPVSDLLPERPTLSSVRAIASGCKACDLYKMVRPRVLVCLGATAAQALLGKFFKLSQQRGQFVASMLAPLTTATVHPSSILRAPDEVARGEVMRRFVADFRKVAAKL